MTGATFPPQRSWFQSNLDFPGIAAGLRQIGFQEHEIAGIMGGNWLDFFERSFDPMVDQPAAANSA